MLNKSCKDCKHFIPYTGDSVYGKDKCKSPDIPSEPYGGLLRYIPARKARATVCGFDAKFFKPKYNYATIFLRKLQALCK